MGDIKKCSKCKTISLKCNFYKDVTTKDGLRFPCKLCTNHYRYNNRDKRNLRERNRRKNDFVFKLANNIRCRTSSAFKSQNVRKTNKTIDLMGVLMLF